MFPPPLLASTHERQYIENPPLSILGHWTIGNLNTKEISIAISGLMTARQNSDGFRPRHEDYPSLHLLQSKGFVLVGEQSKWYLTSDGLKQATISKRLHSGRLVFQPRVDLSIADCTPFEIFEKICDAGWVWKPWVAPRQRGKNCHPIPIAFRAGGPKQFFTTRHPSKVYLQCICLADD